MAHAARKHGMTAEELFIIAGDSDKCELVDGALVRMPPTGGVHGKVALRIGRLLDEYVEAHDLGVVCGAETGFILQRDPDVVRAPDVSFVAKTRIPVAGAPDSYWSIAPDLVVEVVSPNDRQAEVQQKVAEYFAAGARLVWVVDPATRTVCVHRSAADVCTLADDAVLTGNGVLPEFSCPVHRCFD